jgi:hypothetical protein
MEREGVVDALKKANELLEQQVALTRVLVVQQIRDLVPSLVRSSQEHQIYELTDGVRSTREIAKKVGTSHVTVADKWKAWAAWGLVLPSDEYAGRYKKIFSLRDLSKLG